MNNDPQSNGSENLPQAETPSVTPTPAETAPAPNNKKLILIVSAIIGLLLAVLIGLLIMLLNKDDAADTSTNSTGSQSTQQNEDEERDEPQTSSREVVLRAPTSDDKLEYVIYKPQQNPSNTTIYFAIENVCEGCEQPVSPYLPTVGYNNRTGSYLIDDTNGKKYFSIRDQDDKVLSSSQCGNVRVKYGERHECFIAFAKVPGGSKVSWIFGSTRIDNIPVE